MCCRALRRYNGKGSDCGFVGIPVKYNTENYYIHSRGKITLEGNKIVLPILGALLAAVIGGAAWAVIVALTNYELGIVAWAVGGLAGYAVAKLANRQVSAAHQVIAVVASLIGILLGKYFTVGYLYTESFSGIFESEVMTVFQENFSSLFDVMDIVFIALAVATAWQLPKRLARQAAAPAAESTQAAE